MGRPKIHTSSAERVKAHTAKHRIVRITLRTSTVATIDRIAAGLGRSRSELVASMLRFAAAHPESIDANFAGVFDARIDGRTQRNDASVPEGVEWTRFDVATAVQWAIANRQWSRFGADSTHENFAGRSRDVTRM